MKRMIPVTHLCLLIPLALSAQEIPLMRHFLINRDIVALAQAGYSEQTIIDTLLAKPNRFDTNADALVDLAAHGISERVVEAMLLVVACGQGCAEGMEKFRVVEAHVLEQELPVAAKGVAYRTSLDIRSDVRCPMADAALSLVSGKLPPGLRLTMDGLDGTPLETGRDRKTNPTSFTGSNNFQQQNHRPIPRAAGCSGIEHLARPAIPCRETKRRLAGSQLGWRQNAAGQFRFNRGHSHFDRRPIKA
jgi:hypothetical protein